MGRTAARRHPGRAAARAAAGDGTPSHGGTPRAIRGPRPWLPAGARTRRVMSPERWRSWFGTVSLILVAWGVVFAVFGLGVLPVDRGVLEAWESAIYGA